MVKRTKRELSQSELSARSKGGKARAKVLSPEYRSEIGSLGGQKRVEQAAKKKAISDKRREAVLQRWRKVS